MQPPVLMILAIMVVSVVVFPTAYLLLMSRFFHKAKQGTALVRNGMGKTLVSFDAMWVYPVLHLVESIDLSLKRIVVSCEGDQALHCKDKTVAKAKATFFIRIQENADDVRHAATWIGCKRSFDQSALEEIFAPRFAEALKAVAKQHDFDEISNNVIQFKESAMSIIGQELNGYVLDDASIDHLEAVATKEDKPLPKQG